MKRLTSVLCAMLTSWSMSFTFAQEVFLPYLYADYDFATIDASEINSFYNSFNSYFENSLAVPYETLTGNEFAHPNFGIGIRFMSGMDKPLGFTSNFILSRGQKHHVNTATWVDDLQHEVDLRIRDWTFGISVGAQLKSILSAELHVTGYIRSMLLTYSTIYQDGSRSITPEYKLNGLYWSSNVELHYGPQVSLRLGGVALTARYSLPINSFLESSKYDIGFLQTETNHFPPTDFPRDMQMWVEEPIQFLEEDNSVKAGFFTGSRFVIGIEFTPFLSKK
ncbi:MAG: hypothetical protein AAFY71_25390 [Bacteroidota bacterium]